MLFLDCAGCFLLGSTSASASIYRVNKVSPVLSFVIGNDMRVEVLTGSPDFDALPNVGVDMRLSDVATASTFPHLAPSTLISFMFSLFAPALLLTSVYSSMSTTNTVHFLMMCLALWDRQQFSRCCKQR